MCTFIPEIVGTEHLPFFSLLVSKSEAFHFAVAVDPFVMWNTLTSRDCDVISIPAISRSLPCRVWGAHLPFFVSVATAKHFLAVVLVGSPWYQMTLMYYFSKCVGHCLNDVASFPDVSA